MEKYLQKMLDVAKSVGSVDGLVMGDYIRDQKHIHIDGVAASGETYTLELIVKRYANDT